MLTRRTALLASAGLLATPALVRAQGANPMPAAGKRAWAEQVPTLRIGLLGGENEKDRLGRYDGYQKLLETTFGVPVRLYPAADYAGVIQAFGAKQVELAPGMSPNAYAATWLETNGNVEPLLVAVESDGSISYVSVLCVRADSGITDLAGMKGKTLAWADPNSASGYLIPSTEFRHSGININPGQYFSRTGFAGGHEQAVVALLQKQYDGAVTWASGIGDASQGYTRGNLHEMVGKGLLNMQDIRIVWKSKPILNGPLTVRKDLPEAFRKDMLAFHMALPTSHPDIYAAVERGGGQGYRPVTHDQYEIFVEMRKEDAANRRQRS